MNEYVLDVNDLHRSVDTHAGKLDILNGVDFRLKKGQSMAIVGESGSGKSTLLGLLAGLDLPQHGYVRLNQIDITVLNENQRAELRAKYAGFVFQSFYLMEDLNALENVALPLELFGHEKPEKIASEWLNKLGLGERKKHWPKQLSGGEQQRVALCRAFAAKPLLLFADEPTANLDHQTAQLVIKQLFDLHQESKNSMVLVTHDNQLAERCDVVCVLRGGRLNVI